MEDKNLTIDKPAFEAFDYVKLEMTSESVIGDVSKVVIGNERIYVLSLIDPRIFIFSLDGKYINSLKRGNGPGEVLFVSDFEYRNNICMSLTTIEVSNSMTEIYTRFVEGLPDINVAAVGYTDNQIVYSLSSMNLLEYKDNNDIPDDDKLKSLYSSIQNEEDNPYPILVPTK